MINYECVLYFTIGFTTLLEMVQAKIGLKYYGRKNERNVETANMIFPSENFIIITHLLRWSIYIIHKKYVSQSDWLDIL